MDIRNTKQLKAFARDRIVQTPAGKKIVLIYAGISMGLALLVHLIQYLLDQQIGQMSGLGSMGMRSIFSAAQTVLPLIQTGVSMCLGLGYVAAMLRIARGQYVSPNTLRLGFDRFWVLLRLTIAEGFITFGAVMVSMYAATAIFVLSPLSASAMEVLTPLMNQASILDPTIMIDEAMYLQLASSLMPVLYIFAAVLCLVLLPIWLRYRMAQYILIDKPGTGAIFALRESGKMMKGNIWRVVRLDLSFWWYYAASLLILAMGYGDQILPMFGVTLPWSAEAGFYIFLVLYQILQFGLCVFLRNHVETTYALVYDSIRPQEPKDTGVVLGNIFQM